MFERKINSLFLWFFENLSKHKEISHFVSGRIGGFSNFPYNSLNLGFHTGDNPEKVLKNRELLASTLEIPLSNFTVAKQVNQNNIAIITEKLKGKGGFDYESAIEATDAMITNIPNTCLMILVADCVPIFLFDQRKKVIGVVHAGWKGTILQIIQNTLQILKEKFDCSFADILVGIGPSIGFCCYEVGSEIITQFKNIFHNNENYISNVFSNNKGFLNLWEINKKQVMESGIPEKNIEIAKICTHCHSDIFFSARQQKGETGRFGAGIMLKNE